MKNINIFIRLAALVLITVMALATASCAANQPSLDTTGNGNSNGTADSSNSGDKGNEGSSGSDEGQSNENSSGKYSKLLMDVLTNDTYNRLIAQAKAEAERGENDVISSPAFALTPCGFLEQKGFSEQSIRSGDTETKTTVFKKTGEPNNLYINVRAETLSDSPYFTQYCLKYTLSDKEMADFDMLAKGDYIQTPFMIDAISKAKTPAVLSECKISSVKQNGFKKSIQEYSIIETLLNDDYVADVCLMSYDQEAGKAQLMITSSKTHTKENSNAYCNTITITQNTAYIKGNIYGVYIGASAYREYLIPEEENTKAPEEIFLVILPSAYQNMKTLELN